MPHISSYFFDIVKPRASRTEYDVALFIDRDGVVIEERHYLRNPDEVIFVPGSLEALRTVLSLNFFVAVISNQAGLAKGFITESEFRSVNERFIRLLLDFRAKITA